LIKGSLHSKYWLFWIFLTFAPFTLWVDSELVHAPRYLYLPSIGFCILLADLLNKVVHWPKLEKILSPKVSLVGTIILWAIANAGPLYIF